MMKRGLILFVAMPIMLAIGLLCLEFYQRGVRECPSDAVCYYTDKTENVRWFDGHVPELVLFKAYWYDTREAVNATYPGDIEVDAWNECWDLDDGNRYCEIHVVRPAYVYGDPAMDDLGHEVLHGFIDTDEGDFHE